MGTKILNDLWGELTKAIAMSFIVIPIDFHPCPTCAQSPFLFQLPLPVLKAGCPHLASTRLMALLNELCIRRFFEIAQVPEGNIHFLSFFFFSFFLTFL